MIAPEEAATRPPVVEADPQPQYSIPPRVRKAREAAAAQQAYRRWLREQEQAEQRLANWAAPGTTLIEVARAAAHAQVARYQQLAEFYHTACH